MKLSIQTCANMLNDAALNRKSAFQIELSVGLAVFAIEGRTDKTAKAMLTSAYSSAGYECSKPAEIDYKTVNRRVNATADLFDKLGAKTVKGWCADTVETALVNRIISALRSYELFNISDVVRFCDPTKPARTRHDFGSTVVSLFRRASDVDGEHIKTAHINLTIPKDASNDELVELAMKLLAMVDSKKRDLLAA